MSQSQIEVQLGPQSLIQPITSLDRYGFSYVLSEQLGLRRPLRPFCHWVHGWAWWDEMLEPEDLLGPRGVHPTTSIIVGSKAQQERLKACGYHNVLLGGLPFAYVGSQGIQRSSSSLLAFIGHSAEAERMDVADSKYLDYLESIRHDFENVYVSVFSIDHGESLTRQIKRRGLAPFLGANPADKYSMLRTRRALEFCEHVSTNTFGSHIAYALAVGCRVSVFSPTYRYDVSKYLNTIHEYDPSYAERMDHVYSEAYLRQKYGMLFDRQPLDGFAAQELGMQYVGNAHKLPAEKLRAALGWTLGDQIKGYALGGIRRMGRMAASVSLLRNERAGNPR